MAKVVGIGGIFLHFKGDQRELYDWYQEHLGLEMSEMGANFLNGEQLTLLMLKRKNNEGVYINFRVDNLKEMIDHLLENGCKVYKELEVFDFGSFIQIVDPFDNPIELWEPNISNYKKMVHKEIAEYK